MTPYQRVLIVDNSPVFLSVLKSAILTECGPDVAVVSATNHEIANSYLESGEDWLAVVSGYELAGAPCGSFVEHAIELNISTILLTSSQTLSERDKALNFDIVDYFPKELNCLADVACLIQRLRENHRHKILIVDDSLAFCSFAEKLLERQNYQVVIAKTARQALEVISGPEEVTLALIDHILPDTVGSKLIYEIRKLSHHFNLPIIAVSASDEQNIAAHMIKSGASDFLKKPVNHEELLLRIRNSLNLSEQIRVARQAQQSAEKANKAKSQMLSRISHELRTPLNAIMGFSSLIRDDANLEEDQKEALQEIHQASYHLLDMVNETLDLSQIETGKLTLDLKNLSISALIRDVAGLFSALAAQKGIGLDLPIETESGTDLIRTDPRRLKQVLINLINNGIKYNHIGGLLRIRVKDRGHSVSIFVEDTGVGIPADKMDDLFQPFSRLHGHLKEVEGTGLGLAISMSLVELLNGTLTVESTEGIGSTFHLQLPKDIATGLS